MKWKFWLACRLVVFVCFQPRAHDSTIIFTKLYTQVGTGPRKNGLNFWSHLLMDPDQGMFWRILHYCSCLNISRKTAWIFMKIYQRYIFGQGSHFGSPLNSDCGSGYGWLPKFDGNFLVQRSWSKSRLRICSKIWTADTKHIHLGGGLESPRVLLQFGHVLYIPNLGQLYYLGPWPKFWLALNLWLFFFI